MLSRDLMEFLGVGGPFRYSYQHFDIVGAVLLVIGASSSPRPRVATARLRRSSHGLTTLEWHAWNCVPSIDHTIVKFYPSRDCHAPSVRKWTPSPAEHSRTVKFPRKMRYDGTVKAKMACRVYLEFCDVEHAGARRHGHPHKYLTYLLQTNMLERFARWRHFSLCLEH